MFVFRPLARLVGLLLLALLAIAGLAVAIFSIQSGTASLSLPNLAEIIGLPGLRASVSDLLSIVEADGPIALLSLAGGIVAILLGIGLLIGTFAGRRERAFEADASAEGRITARPRPLANAATALAEGTRGVTAARARALPAAGGSGRVQVRVTRPRSASAEEMERNVDSKLGPLRDAFGVKTGVTVKLGERKRRVE